MRLELIYAVLWANPGIRRNQMIQHILCQRQAHSSYNPDDRMAVLDLAHFVCDQYFGLYHGIRFLHKWQYTMQ